MRDVLYDRYMSLIKRRGPTSNWTDCESCPQEDLVADEARFDTVTYRNPPAGPRDDVWAGRCRCISNSFEGLNDINSRSFSFPCCAMKS